MPTTHGTPMVCQNRLPANMTPRPPLVISVYRDHRTRNRSARWIVNVAQPGVGGRTRTIDAPAGDPAPTTRAAAWIYEALGLTVAGWDYLDNGNAKGRVA